MKRKTLLSAFLLVFVGFFSGCELVTEDPAFPVLRPAGTVVINEVFTLPETHQRTFSWVEFYNPTHQTINTRGWTFTFTTTGLLTTFAIDTSGIPNPTSFRQYPLPLGSYEIPFPEFALKPGEFITATNNEDRLLTYTDYGPGEGLKIAGGTGFVYLQDTVVTPSPTTPDTVYIYQAFFQLRTTDQLAVKDSTGAVVDVVRYGNYAHPGPGPDPYPNNRSIGAMPEFQSIARYGGAYFTGNTADDFYITSVGEPLTRPIPHWLSQAFKH